jgi:hypothetical protein
MKWPGEIPAIFVTASLFPEVVPAFAGTARGGNAAAYSPSFLLRWPSVRSRKALRLTKRAVSRWSWATAP